MVDQLKTNEKEKGRHSDFTPKKKNEIEGLTKHFDHTRGRVCVVHPPSSLPSSCSFYSYPSCPYTYCFCSHTPRRLAVSLHPCLPVSVDIPVEEGDSAAVGVGVKLETPGDSGISFSGATFPKFVLGLLLPHITFTFVLVASYYPFRWSISLTIYSSYNLTLPVPLFALSSMTSSYSSPVTPILTHPPLGDFNETTGQLVPSKNTG